MGCDSFYPDPNTRFLRFYSNYWRAGEMNILLFTRFRLFRIKNEGGKYASTFQVCNQDAQGDNAQKSNDRVRYKIIIIFTCHKITGSRSLIRLLKMHVWDKSLILSYTIPKESDDNTV
jgi:hypothetical protein